MCFLLKPRQMPFAELVHKVQDDFAKSKERLTLTKLKKGTTAILILQGWGWGSCWKVALSTPQNVFRCFWMSSDVSRCFLDVFRRCLKHFEMLLDGSPSWDVQNQCCSVAVIATARKFHAHATSGRGCLNPLSYHDFSVIVAVPSHVVAEQIAFVQVAVHRLQLAFVSEVKRYSWVPVLPAIETKNRKEQIIRKNCDLRQTTGQIYMFEVGAQYPRSSNMQLGCPRPFSKPVKLVVSGATAHWWIPIKFGLAFPAGNIMCRNPWGAIWRELECV